MIRKFLPIVFLVLLVSNVFGTYYSVIIVTGEVDRYTNGNWQNILKDQKVNIEERIRTGRKSYIRITNVSGDIIEIKENSEVLLGSSIVKRQDLIVIKGSVLAKFSKIIKNEKSKKIYSPTMTCSIRGTEFTVFTADSGETRVIMNEGTVEISNLQGKVENLNKGSVIVKIGDKPEKETSAKDGVEWLTDANNKFYSNPTIIIDDYYNQFESYKKLISQKINENEIKNTIDLVEESNTDAFMMNLAISTSLSNLQTNMDISLSDTQKYELGKLSDVSKEIGNTQKKIIEDINKIKMQFNKDSTDIKDAFKKKKDEIEKKQDK